MIKYTFHNGSYTCQDQYSLLMARAALLPYASQAEGRIGMPRIWGKKGVENWGI